MEPVNISKAEALLETLRAQIARLVTTKLRIREIEAAKHVPRENTKIKLEDKVARTAGVAGTVHRGDARASVNARIANQESTTTTQ